jgi:1-acyl-sn-glycerol-3-phosphate acyltransferase
VLRAGRQIFIFPEGTRRPPGAPPQYKFGVAKLYEDTGAPCLPVALNTGLFWGRRGFSRRPGVAIIEYLPAIAPGLARDAFIEKLQSAIEAGCERLNADALAGNPALAMAPAAVQG